MNGNSFWPITRAKEKGVVNWAASIRAKFRDSGNLADLEGQPEEGDWLYFTFYADEYQGFQARTVAQTIGWAAQRMTLNKCRVATPDEIKAYLAGQEAHAKWIDNEEAKRAGKQTVTIKPSGPTRTRKGVTK